MAWLSGRGVAEAQILQHQVAADPLGQFHPTADRRGDFIARLQQFTDPLPCPRRPLQLTDHLAEGTEGAADDQAVEDKGRQFAAGNLPGHHVHAADPEHHRHRAQHQHDHQGNQPGPLHDALARGLEGLLDGHGEALLVLDLVVVGLHGLDLAEGFADVAADIGNPILAQARQAAHPPAEDQDRRQHQRQGDDHDAGELGVGDKQQHHPANHHQGIAQEQRERRADHRLQQRGVGGQP